MWGRLNSKEEGVVDEQDILLVFVPAGLAEFVAVSDAEHPLEFAGQTVAEVHRKVDPEPMQ